MNTPNRPHEELDADERELARVVRALPGSEPSPALDLRILKAAQDAAAGTPAKRSHRALWAANSAGSLWGLGTAAAAVLAVGISWQMFMRAPSGNLSATSPAVIAKDNAQDDGSTSVDFISTAPKADQGAAAEVAAAPASQPILGGQRAASAAEPMRQKQESKPVASAAPQPFLDEHVAEANEARERDQAQAATTEQYSNDLRADSAAAKSAVAENAPADSTASAAGAPAVAAAPMPAQAPAAPPPMDAERREQAPAEKPALAKTTANTGLLAGAAAPVGQAEMQSKEASEESPETAKHRVRLDARLYPESWILKIRSRLKHGDTAGARASLKLFVERYPQETVPDNLKPLLGE